MIWYQPNPSVMVHDHDHDHVFIIIKVIIGNDWSLADHYSKKEKLSTDAYLNK